MIQRVQTVYLLLVTIITALMFQFPFINTVQENELVYAFNFNGFAGVNGSLIAPAYLLAVLIALCAGIAFASIFLYKKRKLQLRLNTLNIILYLAIYAVEFLFFYGMQFELHLTDYSLGISSLLPVVCIILTFLAIRAIRNDETLVRSLDRLR